MTNQDLFTKNVVLSKKTDNIVGYVIDKYNLGERGYSIALRMIADQWAEQNMPQPQSEPTQEQMIERLR